MYVYLLIITFARALPKYFCQVSAIVELKGQVLTII